MDAETAFELTKTNWAENETDLLKYVIGYQEKVESAAKAGKGSCVVGVIPMEVDDFVSCYFERLGFYVALRQVSQTDAAVTISWKTIPTMSRAYVEQQNFNAILKSDLT